jgi:hypothetical protein
MEGIWQEHELIWNNYNNNEHSAINNGSVVQQLHNAPNCTEIDKDLSKLV